MFFNFLTIKTINFRKVFALKKIEELQKLLKNANINIEELKENQQLINDEMIALHVGSSMIYNPINHIILGYEQRIESAFCSSGRGKKRTFETIQGGQRERNYACK